MPNYEDIIHLPHHVSKKRPQMPLSQRAAIFAPFSALTGYEDQIKETDRITTRKIELTEEEKERLNQKLVLVWNYHRNEEVMITYFVKDLKKNGGNYLTVIGKVKKLDLVSQHFILQDKRKIKLDDIIDIQLYDKES